MKIIKRYHDYYDSAIGLAYDDRLIYDRKTEHLQKSVLDMSGAGGIRAALRAMPRYSGYGAYVTGCLLAFCGRIYPYWYLQDDFEKWPEVREPLRSGGPLFERLRQIAKESAPDSPWRLATDSILRRRQPWRYDLQQETVERFQCQVSGHSVDPALFHALQCPSFLVAEAGSWHRVLGYHVITNPRLADLNFGHQFDAFACFQEISTYLGGVLARADEAPRTVGDDRVVAQSKGFDDQSFRTLVHGQKKARRQVNRQRKKGL